MTSSFEGLIFPFRKLVKVSDSSTEGGGFESSERHFKKVKGGGPGCRLDLSRNSIRFAPILWMGSPGCY